MKYILHCIFWFFLFTIGFFELVGVPSALIKPIFPFVCFTLFFLTVVGNASNMKMPGIVVIILLAIISLISGLINDMSIFGIIYFLTFLLYPILYFYVLINDDGLNTGFLLKFIVGLCFLQVPVSIIKFFFWGISENGPMGTIVARGSSNPAIFPLIPICFLLPLFYKTNKKKYVLFIALFALIGLIGEKRALYVTLPALIFYSIFLYMHSQSYKLMKTSAKSWALSLIGVAGFVYAFIIFNPTLNPEHKVGGSFDLNYLYGYTTNYVDPNENRFKNMRRLDGIAYFTGYVTSSFKTSIIGDGAGKLVKSQFTEGEGTILEHYGVRYGGRMGLIWMMLQIGITGVVIYLFFYTELFIKIRRKFRHRRDSILYLGFLNLIFVFLFDFLFYSTVSIRTGVIYSLYFFAMALAYRNEAVSLLLVDKSA